MHVKARHGGMCLQTQLINGTHWRASLANKKALGSVIETCIRKLGTEEMSPQLKALELFQMTWVWVHFRIHMAVHNLL